jgi:Family of unknown function (DUF6535)
LLTVSIQDLKPNSQDTTVFYLANIYQLLADPNVSTLVTPPPFSAPKSAVLVNSLWSLSLVISFTCALLATLLQQWARRYVTITQPPRYTPHKRASVRAFFAGGAEKFHLPWSVEALPTLLHLSLFLFFSGFVVYLFNINHTVFNVVVWWVGLAGSVYGCITLMPIFWHDSPYYAPLSSSAWLFYTGIPFTIFRLLVFLSGLCSFLDLEPMYFRQMITYGRRFFSGITKSVQDMGSQLSAEINDHILTFTIYALDEDKELEQFFETIPGLCSSEAVRDLEPVFTEVDYTFAWECFQFLRRTFSSSLVFESDKKKRLMICAKAVDSAHFSYSTIFVLDSLFLYGVDVLQSVDIGQSLRRSGDQDVGSCSQGIIAGIIACVPERDDRWVALVKDQLGISEEVLRDYLANGDSVLLANFIHITPPLFRLCLEDVLKMAIHLRITLSFISKFDIGNTLPGLQHDFCALWNEITREAHNQESFHISAFILGRIQHLYIALHPGADSDPTVFDPLRPSSYPLCNIPTHHSDIAAGETTHSTITSTLARPPEGAMSTITPSTEPDVSSFPALTADHGRVHFADDLPVETNHLAATSLNSSITQGLTDTPSITLPTELDPPGHPVPIASTVAVTPRSSSALPPVSSTDLHTSADLGIVPHIASSSPASVPSETLPSNTQPPLASPASRTDQVTTAPRQLPSTSATAVSRAALNEATFDDDHNPRTADLFDNAEAPQRSQQTALDTTADVSGHSLGTDRPE